MLLISVIIKSRLSKIDKDEELWTDLIFFACELKVDFYCRNICYES